MTEKQVIKLFLLYYFYFVDIHKNVSHEIILELRNNINLYSKMLFVWQHFDKNKKHCKLKI